jgi:FkbM family methyltransferase
MKPYRINPQSDSYEALMWDVITNAHRYIPLPGERVLDLGAHFGMFSLYCAARGCNVDAYEPSAIPFIELCHTAQVAHEIGLGYIRPIRKAIWNYRGAALLLSMGESSAANSLITGSSNGVQKVEACTLDEALCGSDQWDCVKMDIEGAELVALQSAKQLDRVEFLTVEVHNNILPRDKCEEIGEILQANFSKIDRLPVKKHPEQTVAYFCSRPK